jgi:hypothetical protein
LSSPSTLSGVGLDEAGSGKHEGAVGCCTSAGGEFAGGVVLARPELAKGGVVVVAASGCFPADFSESFDPVYALLATGCFRGTKPFEKGSESKDLTKLSSSRKANQSALWNRAVISDRKTGQEQVNRTSYRYINERARIVGGKVKASLIWSVIFQIGQICSLIWVSENAPEILLKLEKYQLLI